MEVALIFVLFISTHLVSTRPAPICRSKTLLYERQKMFYGF